MYSILDILIHFMIVGAGDKQNTSAPAPRILYSVQCTVHYASAEFWGFSCSVYIAVVQAVYFNCGGGLDNFSIIWQWHKQAGKKSQRERERGGGYKSMDRTERKRYSRHPAIWP